MRGVSAVRRILAGLVFLIFGLACLSWILVMTDGLWPQVPTPKDLLAVTGVALAGLVLYPFRESWMRRMSQLLFAGIISVWLYAVFLEYSRVQQLPERLIRADEVRFAYLDSVASHISWIDRELSDLERRDLALAFTSARMPLRWGATVLDSLNSPRFVSPPRGTLQIREDDRAYAIRFYSGMILQNGITRIGVDPDTEAILHRIGRAYSEDADSSGTIITEPSIVFPELPR